MTSQINKMFRKKRIFAEQSSVTTNVLVIKYETFIYFIFRRSFPFYNDKAK